MTSAAPFLIFFLGAALTAVTRGTLRVIVLLAVPLAGALNLYALGEGIHLVHVQAILWHLGSNKLAEGRLERAPTEGYGRPVLDVLVRVPNPLKPVEVHDQLVKARQVFAGVQPLEGVPRFRQEVAKLLLDFVK